MVTEENRYCICTKEAVMKKFVSYEKLSKKEKRKLDQLRRQTWGVLNPATRKTQNSRAYHRPTAKAQAWAETM